MEESEIEGVVSLRLIDSVNSNLSRSTTVTAPLNNVTRVGVSTLR